MAKILVIEDDKETAALICDVLQAEKHTVEAAHDGPSGLQLTQLSAYDAIILDVMLPGMNGFDVCKQVRSQGGMSGILMLTGQDKIQDIEVGLNSGADDYLTKPFKARELIARVRAILRRSNVPVSQNELRAGDVVLDLVSHRITRLAVQIHIPPKPYALLEFLLRHKGQVFSPEALITRVWPADNETSPEIIRNYINQLRKALDVDGQPSIVKTVPKVGYLVQDPDG